MFRGLAKHTEHILWSLGALMVSLILLFFLLNQAAKRAPSPVAGFAGNLASRAGGSIYGY